MKLVEPSIIVNVLFFGTTAVVVLCSLFYLYIRKQYKYWKTLSVPGPKPVPFYGNMMDVFTLKATEPEVLYRFGQQYKDEKYIGIYNLWKPVLVVKDTELSKNIYEKDFENFADHPAIIGNVGTDAVLDSLFTMTGNRWKSRRQVMTKMFTPSKLREYVEDMRAGLAVLMNKIAKNTKDGREFELQKAAEPYLFHSLVSSMYGINLLEDNKRTEALLETSRFFLHPPPVNVIKFLGYSIHPEFLKFFKVVTMPKFHWEEFSSFTKQLTSLRQQFKTKRNDLLTTIMKLLEEGTRDVEKINFSEAVGHVSSFLQAGTHTTKTTLCHVLLRLAENQDIQDKLREEVDRIMNGKASINHDELKAMIYMDNVISESLRLDPLLGVVKRTCTKDYKVDDRLTIKKGIDVYIDVLSMHLDPHNFPEPEKFKPERFSTGEANQAAFMPFGKGPRICLGMRFALLEIKLAVATILSKYILVPSEKMKTPIKFDTQTIFITNIPVGGIWVKFKPRSLDNN